MKKSILFLFSFLSLAFVSNIDAKDPSTARKKNLAELDQTVMPESYDSSYDSPFAGPNEFGTESKIAKPKKVKKQLKDVSKRLDQIRKDIEQISETIQ